MTVDGFTNRLESRRLVVGRKEAILVDEAGLLEDWRWAGVMRGARGAAITVTGDAAQLSPIDAGGLFPLMVRRFGAPTLSGRGSRGPRTRGATSARGRPCAPWPASNSSSESP
jgi:ATP-dependent exoDNAse (exonuclease V) alpha subunit